MDRLRKRHLSKILKDAEIEHIRLYDLRHSCATLLLKARENLKIVADRLGHASIKTTADTYMQSDESMQREATDSLVSVIFDK
jgi:integrase